MTGTEVTGQRCLAGRGLSQFHRTITCTKGKHVKLTTYNTTCSYSSACLQYVCSPFHVWQSISDLSIYARIKTPALISIEISIFIYCGGQQLPHSTVDLFSELSHHLQQHDSDKLYHCSNKTCWHLHAGHAVLNTERMNSHFLMNLQNARIMGNIYHTSLLHNMKET